MTASVGGGTSNTNATSQSSGNTGPWAPSVPYLTAGLQNAGSLPGTVPYALDNAANYTSYLGYKNLGNNFGQQVADQTGQFLGGDPFGLLKSGLSDYKSQLAPFLDPKNLNPYTNPGTQQLASAINDTIGTQQHGYAAAAGRDLSGMDFKTAAQGTANALAPLMFGQYNQNLQNLMNAGSQLFGANYNTSDQMGLNVGRGVNMAAVQPAIAMAPAQAQFMAEQQRQMLPYQMAAAQGSVLLPYGSAGNTTQQQGLMNSNTNSSNWDVGASAKSLKSDIRLKRDIAKVGEHNGLNLYRFRYLDDDETYVGVMAQEVLAIDPDAVEIGEDGFMRVKYHRLGIQMMKLGEWNARAI